MRNHATLDRPTIGIRRITGEIQVGDAIRITQEDLNAGSWQICLHPYKDRIPELVDIARAYGRLPEDTDATVVLIEDGHAVALWNRPITSPEDLTIARRRIQSD